MTLDTMIKNGKIVTSHGLLEVCVGVKDEKIALIGKEAHMPRAENVVDAGGNLILPGMIDMHVHFRDPDIPICENFETGTKAAAAGGVTTVMDMPTFLGEMRTVSIPALKGKIAIIEKKAVVDYALCGAVSPKSMESTITLVKEGICAYKLFMPTQPTGRMGSKLAEALLETEDFVKSDDDLRYMFSELAKVKLPLLIHPESDMMTKRQLQFVQKMGYKDVLAFPMVFNIETEAYGTYDALNIAAETGVHLHVCHISAGRVAEIVGRAKARDQRVSGETGAHYLLLDERALEKLGPYALCRPPIRPQGNQEALWRMLNDGTIDALGSDHAPWPKEEKDLGWKDIFECTAGIPGVETTLPLMLNSVNKGKITLNRLIQVFSENPAKILGLYPRKGSLEIGSDADIVIVDMDRESVIRGEEQHGLQKWTPFEGWRVKGIPILTMVRGTTVFSEEEDIAVKPGYGKFLSRPYH